MRSIAVELQVVLGGAPGDPALRRLFPPAYEEAKDEDEYRRLMGDELLEGRRRALGTMAGTVDRDRLTAAEAEAWLTALNDLRLVLGTRLDVRDDTLLADVDERHPQAREFAVYAYLSWLQEQLVEAMAG